MSSEGVKGRGGVGGGGWVGTLMNGHEASMG